MENHIFKLNNFQSLQIRNKNSNEKALFNAKKKKKMKLSSSEINELNTIFINNNESSRNKINFKNNFLFSSKLNISDNEGPNQKNNDYLFKNRNLRNKIFSNPLISRIPSEKFTLKSTNSDIEEGNSRTNYFSFFSFEKNNSNEVSTKSINSINNNSRSYINKNSRNDSFQKKIKKNLTFTDRFIKKRKGKDQTIINIYNTSVNNNPNIYLLNPVLPNNEKNNKSFLGKINDYFSQKEIKSKIKKELSLNKSGFKIDNNNLKKKILNKINDCKGFKNKRNNYSLSPLFLKDEKYKSLENFSDNSISMNKNKKKKYKLKRSESQKIYENTLKININKFLKKKSIPQETYKENKELRKKLLNSLNKNYNIFDSSIYGLKEEKNNFILKAQNYIEEKLKSEININISFKIKPLIYKKYFEEIYRFYYKLCRHSWHKFERLYLGHIYKLKFSLRLQSYVLSIFMPQTLIRHYFDSESYDGMIELYLDDSLDDIPKKSSIMLIREINKFSLFSDNDNKFIYNKFIQNDLQDGLLRKKIIEEEIKFETEHALKLFTLHLTSRHFNLRFKNTIQKLPIKKLNYNNNIKHSHSRKSIKKNHFKKIKNSYSILKKDIFNRKNDKIGLVRQNSYIRNLQFSSNNNINDNLNIENKVESMKKNNNMSKEGLISRTEEIKLEMKKKLKSFEEILFFLIKEKNFREFKDILERFHISLESRNKEGSTLFMYAIECGFEKFINYLLEKGSDVNAKNYINETALHIALRNHNFKFVDLLIKHGANENIKNNKGLTPWQLC